MWIGGDVNLGVGGKNALLPLVPLLKEAIGIVNLEGPVASRNSHKAGKQLKVFNHPESLIELHSIHIVAVGIANNHSLDNGTDGPKHSASLLQSAGFQPVGLQIPFTTLQLNGKKVIVTAHDLTAGVPNDLKAQLTAARKQGDALIVTFHVTGPPSYLPSPELKQSVEIALNAGASVIAAHGTHALGPVEHRGEAVIAWGLGNVVFDCDCSKEKDAVLLQIEFDQKGTVMAKVIPITAGLQGRPAMPSSDPNAIFDLLEAIGSTKLRRHGIIADF